MTRSCKAFEDLLQQAQRPVLGYLIRLTGSVHAAQDVLQSANVTAMEKQNAFEEGTNFVAWLSQIAINHHRNQIRKLATSSSVMLFDERLHEIIERRHRERMEQHRRESDWQRLNHCLQQLPDHQRELVEHFYLEGKTLNDLAETTGRKANAIGQALHRARQSLIRCVQQCGDHSEADVLSDPPISHQTAEIQ
ncbi:sigma-70 family RNA polymerase sigma factor [Rhodopirellula europaea]|uniref:RNA polymerase sigma-70 ECF-like, Rhodopirellula baltica n=1 Tax=Rhodopirellula europaea 6C TaxID=1263867 RepID=M2AGD9_9BACT|nr:sigma-70 family RNA polymerase sigma factor [Rhodopirellula europaea]EMB16185.1 RNA polymerase sigma-70 ECF-like, Rhodopirellula baltica [Rhodopirellula europaea 6C]